MKKILALLLALCMIFALAACGENAAPAKEEPKAEEPAAEAPAAEAPAAEEPAAEAPAEEPAPEEPSRGAQEQHRCVCHLHLRSEVQPLLLYHRV